VVADERMRHYKQPKQPNESWISSKYDIQGLHWQELQQLYLPELNMCWGPACNSLKKLWKSYKIAGRNGEPRGDIAMKIRNVQSSMGIQQSEFPELEGIGDDQEVEMIGEEKEEDWESEDEIPEESNTEEDEQLRREEIAEGDDWFD
jgi:hypothetical protein